MDINECPAACNGQGSCKNGRCTCDVGFFGEACGQEVKCPNKCSGNGQCLKDASCKCFTGFFGTDCSAGATPCPDDCNYHGRCEINATCMCDVGYSGKSCETKEACPLDCCGNGHCDVQTKECKCAKGWHGQACNLDLSTFHMLSSLATHQKEQFESEAKVKLAQISESKSLKEFLVHTPNSTAQVHALEKHIAELELEAKQLQDKGKHVSVASLSSVDPSDASCPKPSTLKLITNAKKRSAEKKLVSYETYARPEIPDFGIDKLETDGEMGAISYKCKDNCHSMGYCEKGVCYCQPGHYGNTCNEVKMEGPVGLGMMGACLGASLLLAITITHVLLHYNNRQKRKAEREMGYLV